MEKKEEKSYAEEDNKLLSVKEDVEPHQEGEGVSLVSAKEEVDKPYVNEEVDEPCTMTKDEEDNEARQGRGGRQVMLRRTGRTHHAEEAKNLTSVSLQA